MGVADYVLESISGHLSRRMFEHYSHIRIDAKRQALDAFGSSPALGIGPGTFDTWWARHEGSPPLADAHLMAPGRRSLALV